MTVETVRRVPDTSAYLPRKARRVLGLSAGQIVIIQIAIVGIVAAAKFHVAVLAAAIPLAAALIILGWGRMRGRWLSEWFGVWLHYRSRNRRIEAGSDATALLQLAHPGARLSTVDVEGTPAALIADSGGLVALLELGESAVIPAKAWYPIPSPSSLLPTPAPDTPEVRIQLLLHSVATTGSAPVAASYRQLTGGRLLASERAVIAVRVQRSESWPEEDLARALSGAIRKVRAKLAGIPNRPLGEVAAIRVLGEFAGHDGTHAAQEGWSAMHLGGLLQGVHVTEKWPQPHPDPSHALLPRLLRLPATMTCVSLTAGPQTDAPEIQAQLAIRLATPDQPSLANAATALKQVLASDQAQARRLEGEQMDGFLATLPLAAIPNDEPAKRRTGSVAGLTTPYGGSGLMIGLNRHQEPLTIRLFRPEATRMVVIGGVAIAQTVAVRAMALGAYVLVQTTRPWAWEAFSRGLGSGASLTVMAPGPVTVPPGQPLHPLLTIVDAGPVAADRSAGSPWHSTLVLRDDLSPVDVDVLGRADVALLQPLQPAEASVAVSVLGLSRDQESWLSRAQPGMIGLVHKRSVRWAALSQTSYEQQLIGSLNRIR